MSELEKTKLSLFQIQAELRGLAEQRCDALDRLEELKAAADVSGEREVTLAPDILETEAEIKTCDALIRAYVSKEIEKVDSCSHVLLELTARSAIHRQEADRLYMLAKSEESTRDRIKELILAVMEEFGEKRLRGRVHDLVSVGNGGVQPLVIAQPDLVPKALQRVTVKCSRPIWDLMRGYLDRFWGDHANITADDLMANVRVESEPDNASIRAALVKGEGVPGCRLDPRGKNLQIK